ncbi:unnamed protein product [Nyctereutes procyonoides]|uniref:(raccoon dog) hypothetical protein n=1 Tax=Nyctereutes procyonoides TaxID=34880 RepID=A0A811ZH13_NYCPR|nr:unnamed protein product [Nyctereutes procyonoides]
MEPGIGLPDPQEPASPSPSAIPLLTLSPRAGCGARAPVKSYLRRGGGERRKVPEARSRRPPLCLPPVRLRGGNGPPGAPAPGPPPARGPGPARPSQHLPPALFPAPPAAVPLSRPSPWGRGPDWGTPMTPSRDLLLSALPSSYPFCHLTLLFPQTTPALSSLGPLHCSNEIPQNG